MFTPFSDEQLRTLVNLEQRYSAWIDAERVLAGLPYGMKRKTVNGRAYLYEVTDREGNGKSLGPWSEDAEHQMATYKATKADAKARRDAAWVRLSESARLYRALRLPLMASPAGALLREADRRRLLDTRLLVVGTNAMLAYSIEAGGQIDLPDETEDFDLAWSAVDAAEGRPLWNFLKAVDPTYTVNSERKFQVRNRDAYEVEILIAPTREATFSTSDLPRPVPLPEQEWLLLGRTIRHVLVCRDGSPAPIVVPDPRWMALHKLWLSGQAKRNPLKRRKDKQQGEALLHAVASEMPQFPMNADFVAQLPKELAPIFNKWQQQARP